jgi:hypothetical protein
VTGGFSQWLLLQQQLGFIESGHVCEGVGDSQSGYQELEPGTHFEKWIPGNHIPVNVNCWINSSCNSIFL